MSDWIYVNMASVSVYRSYAKYVLEWYQDFDTHTPPPPPPRTIGDCLCLPLSSANIMIIILSRGLIQLAGAK